MELNRVLAAHFCLKHRLNRTIYKRVYPCARLVLANTDAHRNVYWARDRLTHFGFATALYVLGNVQTGFKVLAGQENGELIPTVSKRKILSCDRRAKDSRDEFECLQRTRKIDGSRVLFIVKYSIRQLCLSHQKRLRYYSWA
jgi:hypothetical protein